MKRATQVIAIACVLSLVLILAAAGRPAMAEPISWTTTGPVGYWTVYAMLRVGATLYAAGSGGHVYSRTGSGAWVDTGFTASSTPDGEKIYALEWDGVNTLYCGNGNGHVFSRTGSGPWVDTSFTGGTVRALAWNGTTLYSGDESGNVYSWTPGGSWTWFGSAGSDVSSLVWDGDDTLYAGSSLFNGRVSASVAGGPFGDYGDPTGNGYINVLAWDGTDTLYAGCGYGHVAARPDGDAWTDLGPTGGTYTYSLEISGTTIYAGDFDGHVYSKTGSDPWVDLGNTAGTNNYVWAVVYDGVDTLYAGCDDGHVYAKTGGGPWTDTTCKGTQRIESLTWGGPNTLFAGCNDGHVYSRTGTGPWTDFGYVDVTAVTALAWDGVNTLYAGTGGVYARTGGGPWTNTGLPGGTSVVGLAWDGADTLYAACGNGNVYSRTGGSPWASTSLNAGNPLYALVWDGADTLYASDANGYVYSKTGSSPWASKGFVGAAYAYSLAFNGASTLYAGCSNGHVYYKTGTGAWTDAGDTAGTDVFGLACIQGTVYAGCYDGHVYAKVGPYPWTDTGDTGDLAVFCLAYNGTDTLASGGFIGVNTGEPTAAVTHFITASAGANGAIDPAGTVVVNDGEDQAFTITPAANHHIETVTVDGASVTPTSNYTFNNVSADHTINATFAADASQNATWYLAEGSTAWGYSCYISIQNPNTTAADCEITYMTSGGPVSGGTVTLPPSSQATVFPADVVGAIDFSTRVVCREGMPIAVDRTMTWTGEGAQSEEAHSAVGVPSPNTTWYLAEGSSEWGFECWLLIQNPNAQTANCQVTYMIEGAGPQVFDKQVAGNSRATFGMKDDIGARDASIKVTSDVPVIPERAMYRDARREGHDSIGTVAPATDYFLAEGTTAWGFTDYVLVQNPNDTEVEVTTTYMTPSGPVTPPAFTMPANSRKTVRVNDVGEVSNTDLSTWVHGSGPIIAERAMYWKGGPDAGEACHDSIGMAQAHMTFFLPDGQTTDGRETWTLVQNPNDSTITAEITYMTPDGQGNVTKSETIPANSRRTFNMLEHSGVEGRAAIMVTSKTAGKPIMCERAMYWNNRGAGTDTIGGFSE
ncbi:MAG: hypothetical protein KKF41_03460 [Actinobacteria bacterium]|nr:hypothetical protein [Actinomycetota bacterium]MBU1945040.1 hypothetical protein [Actinomycetota bacterium]MBU2686624.1 hypothetical protein [Actinomycetota bacterium]